MSVKDVFSKVCERNNWLCKEGRVEIYLDAGRSQVVHVEEFVHDGEEMVRIHSKVGSADVLTLERLRAVLSINYRLAHGALAIHDDYLVMTDTFLIREADHDEVAASIRYIAAEADRYERLVYEQDLH